MVIIVAVASNPEYRAVCSTALSICFHGALVLVRRRETNSSTASATSTMGFTFFSTWWNDSSQ